MAMPLMAVASWWICSGLIGKKEAEIVHLETDCVRYIEKALPQIVGVWSYPEWKSRATVELLNSLKQKRVKKDFVSYRRVFGELKRLERPIGRVDVDNTGGVPETYGYYTASAKFATGRANIAMRLVKRAGGWKFQQFRIRSEATAAAD